MSKVNALYHIVFCTKNRRMTIPPEYAEDLYRFIWNMLRSKDCHLYRISGIENHIHMLINLSSTVALAPLMRDIKAKSSGWLRTDHRFAGFDNWAKEYFAATIAYKDRGRVIDYIKGQREHHHGRPFDDELEALMRDEDMTSLDGDMM